MRKLIIFCNAPFFVQHTLGLYEKHKEHSNISIFVLQVEGIFRFLKSLDLDVEQMEFLPNIPEPFRLGTPRKNLKNKRMLDGIIQHFFAEVRDADVFFPGSFYDPVMHACIAALVPHNAVVDICAPSFDTRRIDKYPFRLFLHLKLCQLMTGTRTYFASLGNSEEYALAQFFDNAFYGVPRCPQQADTEVVQKYSWKPDVPRDHPTLLFMENDLGHRYVEYEKTMRKLLETFTEAGFQIYIKPHPRIGCSPFLRNLNGLKFLPAHIPAQFIRDEDFDAIGSLYSTALIDFAITRKQTFCFEMLFHRKSERDRSYAIGLMTQEARLLASGVHLLIPENWASLREMLGTHENCL